MADFSSKTTALVSEDISSDIPGAGPLDGPAIAAGVAQTLQVITDTIACECVLGIRSLVERLDHRPGQSSEEDSVEVLIFLGECDVAAVAQAFQAVMDRLRSKGFQVHGTSYGQFAVRVVDQTSPRCMVNFYAAWTSGQTLSIYPGIESESTGNLFMPFADTSTALLKVPNDPQGLVELIYGCPVSQIDLDSPPPLLPEIGKRFEALDFSRNVNYWDDYYEARSENDVWAVLPSQFCTFVANELSSPRSVLEVGCGNGRDSVFFAHWGHDVVAADYSDQGIKAASALAERRGVQLETHRLNVYDAPGTAEFGAMSSERFDVVYARFFVHAVSEVGESNFLELAFSTLRPGAHLYVEFRTVGDERSKIGEALVGNERVDGHYRRFIEPAEFIARCNAAGFVEEYAVVGCGMAKYRNEDPEVCRAVLRKP